MHKMPQFGTKKRFSCTKGRSLGLKKDFHAQKAAVSVSKKFFVHKMPQFEEQKRFYIERTTSWCARGGLPECCAMKRGG